MLIWADRIEECCIAGRLAVLYGLIPAGNCCFICSAWILGEFRQARESGNGVQPLRTKTFKDFCLSWWWHRLWALPASQKIQLLRCHYMSSSLMSCLMSSFCSFPHGKQANSEWIFHFSLLTLCVTSGAATAGMAPGQACRHLSSTQVLAS